MIKIIKFCLIILIFSYTLFLTTNSFDPDLGWHLRFGQDALHGDFQYLDSYTFTHFDKPWTNHEWGWDIFLSFIYPRFGYLAMSIIISLAITSGFILGQKLFTEKITTIGLVASLIGIYSIKHLIVMRPAMLAVLFCAIILLNLKERYKNLQYIWPILFWAWSSFHGSWILGFAIIAINFIGRILQILFAKKLLVKNYTLWNKKDFLRSTIMCVASLLIIILNPYGIKIWTEVIEYFFGNNFYQKCVTEWLPSWTYPIFWTPLILSTVALCVLVLSAIKKQINFPEFLLFIFIYASALKYKRNTIISSLLSVPIIISILDESVKKISGRAKNIGRIFIFVLSLAGIIFCFSKINYSKDIFAQKNILLANIMPINAAEYLVEKTKTNKNTRVFNEFRWGGYLNYVAPNIKLFLDGRGTATWKNNFEEPLLSIFQKIKFEPGGLKIIEKMGVDYILLQTDYTPYRAPTKLDELFFTKKDLAKILTSEEGQLHYDLKNSANWVLIYNDQTAKIWQRASREQE